MRGTGETSRILHWVSGLGYAPRPRFFLQAILLSSTPSHQRTFGCDLGHLRFLTGWGKIPFMNFDSSAFVAEPDLLRALRQHAFPVDCRVDRELFRQGDDPTGLFILDNGEAAMFLEDADGSPVVMVPMVPGALLGLPALIGDKPYSMTAVAKAGAKVGFIVRDAFSALMLSDPLLAMMILRVMAAELHSARIAIAGTQNGSDRSRVLSRECTEEPSLVTQSAN